MTVTMCSAKCIYCSLGQTDILERILRSCDRASLTNFFIIKPTRCTNFTNLFWHETGWNCSSILVLLESCLQTCMTYVYTTAERTVNKLLMMDRGTVRNMSSFKTKLICEISASSWFYYKEILERIWLILRGMFGRG